MMIFSKSKDGYISDYQKFLESYKKKNPSTEREQYEGRAIFWDKEPIDLDDIKPDLKQPSYAYYEFLHSDSEPSD